MFCHSDRYSDRSRHATAFISLLRLFLAHSMLLHTLLLKGRVSDEEKQVAQDSQQQYAGNMAVDYLMFIANYLQNAIDIAQKNKVSPDVLRHLRAVKTALLLRSLRYGRMLVALFFLTLFWPLRHLQWLRSYRHHYYGIEWTVNRLAHLTDSLHRKNSL